jgi:hypothetical protein
MNRSSLTRRVTSLSEPALAPLQDAAVRSDRRQVTGRIHKPEAFPFITQRTHVFRCPQQLLDSAFWSGGIEWHPAADGWCQTGGQ